MRCAGDTMYILSKRHGDTAVDRHRKVMVTLFLCFTLFGSMALIVFGLRTSMSLGVVCGIAEGVSAFVLLFYLAIVKAITKRFLIAFVMMAMFAICMTDLMVAPKFTRWWSVCIVLVDVLLVIQADEWLTKATVGTMVLYLSVVELEYAARMGVLDLPGSLPQDERRLSQDCATLPCSTGFVNMVLTLPSQLLIFLLDYYFTRGFASEVGQEKARVEASVDAAQNIAVCLATFDLEAAAAALQERADVMPAELSDALRGVLGHLLAYKPYLPQALLNADDSTPESATEAPPPGAAAPDGDPHVAIAFTDIKSSTVLWEERPAAMCEAMSLHNRLVRGCISRVGGYEVKTIGDSFMVAFTTALDAVRFGLDVQRGLLEVEWPAGLGCGVVEGWPGLCVRVGVHYGPVTLEWNPLMERMDYLGPTVNRAARLEGHAPPGGMAVLHDVLQTVPAEALTGTTMLETGGVVLKGVPGKFAVTVLGLAAVAGDDSSIGDGTSGGKRSTSDTWNVDSACTSQVSGGSSSKAGAAPVRGGGSALEDLSRGSLRGAVLGETVATIPSVKCTVAQLVVHTAQYDEASWQFAQKWFLMAVGWLRRTEGSLVSVWGGGLLAGWGLLRRTSMHAIGAFRFASLAQQCFPRSQQRVLMCGLSTGAVTGCHLGDSEARFVVYGGRCINLCSSLCALAQRLRADVLYATETESVDPSLLPAVRPVGRVLVSSVVGAAVTAHEVHCEGGGGSLFDTGGTSGDVGSGGRVDDGGTGEKRGEDPRGWGWSEEATHMFSTGDYEAVRARAEASGDHVLAAACRLMAAGMT